MRHKYPHTINPKNYRLDSTKRTWAAAKNRKRRLRLRSFRVKVRKDENGYFGIWIKDVTLIAWQRDQGNGRVHV